MPRTAPPPDYHAMMQEFYKMRIFLQAVLDSAAGDEISKIQVEQINHKLDTLILDITKAIIAPAQEV